MPLRAARRARCGRSRAPSRGAGDRSRRSDQSKCRDAEQYGHRHGWLKDETSLLVKERSILEEKLKDGFHRADPSMAHGIDDRVHTELIRVCREPQRYVGLLCPFPGI